MESNGFQQSSKEMEGEDEEAEEKGNACFGGVGFGGFVEPRFGV